MEQEDLNQLFNKWKADNNVKHVGNSGMSHYWIYCDDKITTEELWNIFMDSLNKEPDGSK